MNDHSIYDNLGCPVLAKNMIYINQYNINLGNLILDQNQDNLKLPSLNVNIEEYLNNIDEAKQDLIVEAFNELNFYEEVFCKLAEKYDFPEEQREYCNSILNGAASQYLIFENQKWLKHILPFLESEIIKLQNAAYKFNYYLEPFLTWPKEFDEFFDGYPVHQTIKNTQKNLEVIQTLKDKLRSGRVGDIAKLGDKAPLGNLGLFEFIKCLLPLWNDTLGRTLIQKYDGKNGRKQFLEFLMDCLAPIHPTLKHDTVDNALKKFQKQNRTKGQSL